jgi:hypothetical protein
MDCHRAFYAVQNAENGLTGSGMFEFQPLVRYWLNPDIPTTPPHVRFTPENRPS